MKYTINNKQYTQFDINKRCAALMGLKVSKEQYLNYGDRDENVVLIGRARDSYGVDYCNNPQDTWPIIEKCWDELNESVLPNGGLRKSFWQHLMQKHNCSKLEAACICYIEMNEVK